MGKQFYHIFFLFLQGIWQRGRTKKTVAIKQLLPKFRQTKLQEFIHLSYQCLARDEDEATLVGVLGTTLATPWQPMALITEYYPRGPLDLYLADARTQTIVREVDLVEACTSLSRALWYLEEHGLVHGNIRAANVFVADHDEAAFRVKLGDTGMSRR